MKIVYIRTQEMVKKTKKELEEENDENKFMPSGYKTVDLKEPIYIVELTTKELQLISFYLELEKRKPIMNVKIDTKLKEKNNE